MNLTNSANRWNDHLVAHLLTLQVKQGHPRDIGGLWDANKGFTEPASAPRMIDAFLAAYYSDHSGYCGQETVLTAARMALSHLNLNTHEDGTIDLLETNYHDSTANAFSTQVLLYTYRMMKQYTRHTPLEDTVQAQLLVFLKNSARAMLSGGFHTPNHRWVTASALALCYREFQDTACRELMTEYLDEGIDNDAEGEYTERSVGIYDIACDQSLLMILREMDMPALIKPVLRNLLKLPYYIEPDGTVATLNSRRQDFSKKLYPYPYLLNCLFALQTPHAAGDERYLRLMGLTEFLYAQYNEQADAITFPPDAGQFVTQFLLNPALADCEHPSVPLCTDYKKLFPLAGVARARAGKAALTLVRQRPGFLKLQIGELTLMLRAASTFFGVGQMIPDDIEPIANGWRLRRQSEGGYMRPLGRAAGSTVWEEIPLAKRQWVNVQKLDWKLDVLVFDDRIELRMDIQGCERLPWKLEAILSPGGALTADGGEVCAAAGDTAILEQGFTYRLGSDELRWDGGKKEHVYTVTMRNALPKEEKAFTVYNTGFTPGKHKITLRWK